MPPLTFGTSGGNKDATEIHVGTSGGNKAITEGWVGTSGGNKQFYASETISLSGVAVSSTGNGSQTATYTLESDGDVVTATTPLGSADIGDWISPKASAPSDYEVRATLNSGTLNAGSSATGSWLALTSNRSWGVTRTVVGVADTGDLTIEIRKGSGATLASANVTLDAERTS